MSCEQELFGSYKLSTKAWAEFKKKLADKLKYAEQRGFESLMSNFEKLKELAKDKDAIQALNGKSNSRFYDLYSVRCRAWEIAGSQGSYHGRSKPTADLDTAIFDIESHSFPPNMSTTTTAKGAVRIKVVKPTKKAVKDAVQIKRSEDKENGIIHYLDAYGTRVKLYNKTRKAEIRVVSGNRSVDDASSESLLHNLYFDCLPREWARATGGCCTLLEESMDDIYSSFRMNKSTVRHLGPLGKAVLDREHAMLEAQLKPFRSKR